MELELSRAGVVVVNCEMRNVIGGVLGVGSDYQWPLEYGLHMVCLEYRLLRIPACNACLYTATLWHSCLDKQGVMGGAFVLIGSHFGSGSCGAFWGVDTNQPPWTNW